MLEKKIMKEIMKDVPGFLRLCKPSKNTARNTHCLNESEMFCRKEKIEREKMRNTNERKMNGGRKEEWKERRISRAIPVPLDIHITAVKCCSQE